MDDKDNSLKIDFSSINKFWTKKHAQTVLLIALILIPVIFTIYIRLQPAALPATDTWARDSVNNYYRNSITQQVNAQYPNLPSQQKDTLINEQFASFQKENKDLIQQQVKETSTYFKTGFQYEENGRTWTFLGDLDSYYYLRQARNIENHGNICDEIKDGKCWDNHLLAPIGGETGASMHPYGMAYLHKVLTIFSPSVTLMYAAFLLPTLVAVVAAIAAFFIGRRLMNNVAGFFAAMLVAVSPLFLSRTLGSDTDVWNVMFPLVILWVFIEAYEARSNLKKYSLTGAAGLLIGLFSFAWGGWWYVFDFMVAAIIAFILFEIISSYVHHKSLRKASHEIVAPLTLLGILVISSAIFVSLFSNFQTYAAAFTSPLSLAGTIKSAAHANLWPNVYTTVAELNEASIGTIIGQLSFGITFLFTLAMMGIILMLVKKNPDLKEMLIIAGALIIYTILISNWAMTQSIYLYLALFILPIIAALVMLLKHKDSAIDIKLSLILMIWFAGMIFASTKGVRFILLLVPAFSIALGVTIGYAYQYLAAFFRDSMKMKDLLAKTLVFVLLCLILIVPITAGVAAGKSFTPSITKGWWDTLTKIREESKPDAIINSWWDFGHWFKYVADRRVTLDGVIQNHPNAHWLGRALQAPTEQETIAILRMLDCGSNKFFERIDEKYQDTERSANIVKAAIMMDRQDAITYLKSLGFDDAEQIVELSHCEPPEDFFITSEDMVGKAGVWAHFGLWDFDRAYIINEVKPRSLSEGTRLLKERFNYSDEEATRIYYEVQALQTDREMNDWISPWPSYAGGLIGCQEQRNGIVLCNINMGIGNNGQTITVIDRAMINISAPENSKMVIAFYDQSGRKLQETNGSFYELAIMDNTTRKYRSENASISLGMLLSVNRNGNQTSYNALIAEPNLIDSTFTKLFFFEGKNMDHFEKFYDTTDITGTRIITWKVRWE